MHALSKSLSRIAVVVVLLSGPSALGPDRAAAQGGIVVRVDAGQVLRELPDRAIFGHNLSFAGSANGAWDARRSRFRRTLWQRLEAINPGLLRYPGGNWSYGFHFNLARAGIPHWVNTDIVTPKYRPQDFLKTLRDLPDARALIHLSPIWSSPEEAAAFVAYMIGEPDDVREIGLDSWYRVEPDSGLVLDWKTVGHWARMRQVDGQAAYRGTLYFQLGNEEWFGWCGDGSCEGRVDYYGLNRPRNKMTVEDEGLVDPVSGVAVPGYWPAYRETYLRIRGLFDAGRVKIGALALARPDGVGGADAYFRTAGRGGKRWNVALLDRLNADPEVTADFLTIHTYMYDRRGWESDFPEEGAVNALFASDHLAARIETIFAYADSPKYPVMVTEFNVHLHDTIAPSSLLAALSYVDRTVGALGDDDIVGMARWQVAQLRNNPGSRGSSLFVTNATRGGRGDFWKMGSYYAALLMAPLHRQIVSSVAVNVPTYRPESLTGRWVTRGSSAPWWTASELPTVASAATLSDDGAELVLLLLNKNTTSGLDVEIDLAGFNPASAYRKSVLNVASPSGHGDLFAINPWRNTSGQPCVPRTGGCTGTLPSEAGENVVLRTTEQVGARGRFTTNLPAHSATVLIFQREQP